MKRKRTRRADWWSGSLRSIEVGSRLRLVPYWERPPSSQGRVDLIIDPGPSFGAGDHPTTLMGLELLEVALALASKETNGPSLLDVGTGTGVLAIAGKALGTGFTVGFDPDSAAVFTARRNLRLNRFSDHDTVRLFVGETGSIGSPFDIVAANLVAPLLLRLRTDLAGIARSFLLLSGIADPMATEILDAYGTDDFRLIESKAKDGWNSALLRRLGA